MRVARGTSVAQLRGEPSVARADIDDGGRRGLATVGDDAAEEPGAGDLPRVPLLVLFALAQIHDEALYGSTVCSAVPGDSGMPG